MCVCAPNSPAGLLYCQSAGPAVCLTDPFIFRLAIVSQIFPTLSNLLRASHPQAPQVIILMCLILEVFHPYTQIGMKRL